MQTALNFSLRPQVINSLVDNSTQVGGRQAVGNLNRLRAELRKFFVETVEARTYSLVILQILPASKNIVVNLLQTFAQPPALLVEGLP